MSLFFKIPIENEDGCILLDYAIEVHLHPSKRAERDNGRWGSPNNTLPSSSQAHHGSPSVTRLYKPRGPQWCKCKQEHKLRTWSNGGPNQTPPRSVPGDPQPQCSGVKPITMSQYQSTSWTEGWSLPRHVGHIMEHRGKAQDLLWGVDRRNQRQGQGWIYTIWGGTGVRKQKSKWIKRASYVQRVCCLVQLPGCAMCLICPVCTIWLLNPV